ncbi:MAG: serine hydrolase domain-containing protein [Vicinamibacterales bacterium]
MKRWQQTALTVVTVAVGLVLALWLGLHLYIAATSTPLHPDPKAVPSVSQSGGERKWGEAVAQAQQIVRAGVSEQNLPGLSIAVGAGGRIVWAEGFGWADLDTQAAVSPETRFRIGHASVALTSAGAGLLLERNRLNLDDEIQMHVPSYPKKQWPLTLGQLMGHLGGVRHYGGEGDYMPSTRCERASDGLTPFADDPLRFEPGTQYRYSTFGWVLVSAAIEAAADEPFFTFMRTQVFVPLGMEDTAMDSGADPMPERATFYYPRFKADTHYGPETATVVDYSCVAGGGGYVSTPSDLVRFGIGLSSGTLLQPATVQRLHTPQRLSSGEESSYGLGWKIQTVPLAGEPTTMASYDGGLLIGGSTSLLTFPDRGLVVAVTTNISYANVAAIATEVAQAFAERGKHAAPR